MLLKIDLPDNLITPQLVQQDEIPCICCIGAVFEVRFEAPLTPAVGVVEDWSREKIEERAPAGAGGRWTHYCNGRVTLRKISQDLYEIMDLAMFYESFGWLNILSNGEYAEPGEIWDEE